MPKPDNLAEKLQEIVDDCSEDTIRWTDGYTTGTFNHTELLTALTIYLTSREEQIRAAAYKAEQAKFAKFIETHKSNVDKVLIDAAFEQGREYERTNQ